MLSMLWPILVVVTANTFYNICAKSTPTDANTFSSLTVTYIAAAIISAIMFFISPNHKSIATEISKLNWTSIVLGIAIVGLEFGNISMYRAGWKISAGSVVSNISLACVLIFVGLIMYKESISIRQIVGIFVCVAGLVLITK